MWVGSAFETETASSGPTVEQSILRVTRLHIAEDLQMKRRVSGAQETRREPKKRPTSFCSSGDVLLDSIVQGISSLRSAAI
jgi:hypothetical protein